jgi:hypothetical protein
MGSATAWENQSELALFIEMFLNLSVGSTLQLHSN